MSSVDDDIPPPPESVIERVAPAFGAVILRAERASKVATVEQGAAAIKAVKVVNLTR